MLQEILIKAKKENRPIRIYAHKNPDGDAVAAAKTLERFFRENGIDTEYVVKGKPNNFYSEILGETNSNRSFIPNEAISIILDTSTADYVENDKYRFSLRKNTYVIDHHEKPDDGTAIENTLHLHPQNVLRCPNFSSTCEIIGRELRKIKKLNPDYSTMLLVGTSTDTASFKYLKPTTLNNLKMFLRFGGNLKKVQALVNKKRPLKLDVGAAKALTNVSRIKIGNTYLNYLGLSHKGTQELQEKYGITNLQKSIFKLANIEDTSLNVIMAENEEGKLTCEFRSISFAGNINVFNIANANGGGGHYNASGCNVQTNGDMPGTARKLLEDLSSSSLDTLVSFKPDLPTENDKKLAEFLTKIDYFNGTVKSTDIEYLQELLKQGDVNYHKTYENLISFKKFMIRNEILTHIPDDELDKRDLSFSIDSDFIQTLSNKYGASIEDIKDATDVFDTVDIDTVTISLPDNEKISLDYTKREKDQVK